MLQRHGVLYVEQTVIRGPCGNRTPQLPCKGRMQPVHLTAHSYCVDNAGLEPALRVCHTRVLPLTLIARGDRRELNPHREGHNLLCCHYNTVTAEAVGLEPTRLFRAQPFSRRCTAPMWQRFQERTTKPSSEAHVGIEPTLRLLCRQPLTASEAMDQSGKRRIRTPSLLQPN